MTTGNRAGLHVHPDPAAVAAAVAEVVDQVAVAAVRERGVFHLVLAGGSTPQRLYRMLSARYRGVADAAGRPPPREWIDWSRTHVWFGDERCVGPEDARSNYRMARTELLEHVPIAASAVHAIDGGADPDQAARRYEAELAAAFDGESVRFDLVLLGMGEDGHTASLFAASSADPREEERLVRPSRAPGPPHDRVTLSFRALNAAREVVFLVTGGAKARTLRAVFRGRVEHAGSPLPASRIRPANGRLRWFVDQAAAAHLRFAPE